MATAEAVARAEAAEFLAALQVNLVEAVDLAILPLFLLRKGTPELLAVQVLAMLVVEAGLVLRLFQVQEQTGLLPLFLVVPLLTQGAVGAEQALPETLREVLEAAVEVDFQVEAPPLLALPTLVAAAVE